jgi:uncharacterized Tic20 family protein
MNYLPIQARLLAALCHLCGLLWMPGVVIYLGIFLGSMWGSDGNHGGTIPAGYGGLVLLIFCLPVLFWLLTRRVHDFVDRAGKESVNAQFSVLLYYVGLMFLGGISCGIGSSMPLFNFVGIVLMYCFLIGIIIYLAAATMGMIQALLGNVFRYPLIIRFFSDSDPN